MVVKGFVGLIVAVLVLRLGSSAVGALAGLPSMLGGLSPSLGGSVSTAPAGAGGLDPAHVKQVACWAYEGGWSPADIPTAAAITFPESNGDPSVIQKGQPAALTGWGLWQITPGDPSLLDPVANARAAQAKYLSQGWGAWTTYTGGQFRQYLPAVEADLAGFDYSSCGRAA